MMTKDCLNYGFLGGMSMFDLIEYQLGLIRWADANPDKWYKHELYPTRDKHDIKYLDEYMDRRRAGIK